MKNLFFHLHLLETKRRAWITALFFAGYILVSASFALSVVRWLQGYHLLGVLLAGLMAGLLLYLLAYFIFFLKIQNLRAYLGLAGLFLVAIGLMRVMVSPAEKIHLLEYSLLALLFFKACHFHFKGIFLYGVPLLLTVGFSWLDELWQGVLPERVYDIRDVLFNTGGGILGIALAWLRRRYVP